MKPGNGSSQSHRDRVLRQARACLGFGWSVIAVQPHGKAPIHKNWTKTHLKASEVEDTFGPDDNLGLLLGEGLVDADLDSDEAIRAASFFLPDTGRVYGRASKPQSHSLYCVDRNPAPAKFTDTDCTVIVELRSTNQQSVIPPSRHPTGERYRWKRTDPPTQVDCDVLSKAVSKLAACALIARHWPPKGSRHELTLALSGFLLRAGWPIEEVTQFVTAAACASMSDEEWRSRQRDVVSTIVRLANGKAATGTPRLAALIGDDVVAKLRDWLEIPVAVLGSHPPSPVVPWPNPLGSDAFRGLAGKVVSLIEPHSESDPVALLSQLLVGFGNMVGRKAHFEVEADRHYSNLFICLVGATGRGRKGSSLAQIMRILREADPEWADSCVVSGLSSGEGLIWAVRDETFSKDGEKVLDAGVSDKRLLAVESEMAQQLKLMSREGNILSTVVRQAWDSGNLRMITKNSPAQATGVHVSILGHITQAEVRRHLNETELANGFAIDFFGSA